MDKAILLAVAASLCTATSSVCQRLGASKTGADSFGLGLIVRLARRPVWLAGIGFMILGFAFQVSALHFGALALVQPILALELLFVFAYMAILGSRRVQLRDWLAASGMSVGLALFLLAAAPSGGQPHAPGSSWWLAGLATAGVVLAGLVAAFGLGARRGAQGARRAAVLGAATGLCWGFVAAVIKEFSSQLGAGAVAIFSSWPVYALIGGGAASLLLASHALASGPLAASQPGFTILDPLAASLLGMFLFGEHIRTGTLDLAAEAVGLALVVAGVVALSHSHLVQGENAPRPAPPLRSGRAARAAGRRIGARSSPANRRMGPDQGGLSSSCSAALDAADPQRDPRGRVARHGAFPPARPRP
jgi:drug/metabolite transporter (DMT)-like permease